MKIWKKKLLNWNLFDFDAIQLKNFCRHWQIFSDPTFSIFIDADKKRFRGFAESRWREKKIDLAEKYLTKNCFNFHFLLTNTILNWNFGRIKIGKMAVSLPYCLPSYLPTVVSTWLWCICLSASLPVCQPLCLFIRLSGRQPVCQPVCLFIRVSGSLYVCLSVCLAVCLSVHLPVCPSIQPSICPSVSFKKV